MPTLIQRKGVATLILDTANFREKKKNIIRDKEE